MNKKSFIIFICLVLLGWSTVTAWNVKIIDSSGIDATELKSLVYTVTEGCETDQQKMEALWGFITRRPFYHWCEAREGREAAEEFGIVYDPIKAFNVYGTVICYQVADLLANMALEAGIPARTRGFPYKHKVMEAFFDSSWHLFDAQYDCQAIYYKPDGKTIASLDEVDSDPQYYLFEQPHPSNPFFQFEKFGGNCWPWETREWVKKNWYEYFETDQLGHYYPFDQQGHRMIISLRRGEKLVRYWDNQGKWFCTAELKDRWFRDLTQKWVALGPHDPRNPLNTYANGRLIYRPDWRSSEDNFFHGLYQGENYRLESGRIYPAEAEVKAWVSFRVSSPYLLAGHPNRLSVDGDSKDGALFKAVFYRENTESRASISISTDEGHNWRAVWRDTQVGKHPVELDLTNFVEGGYSYLLRIELEASHNENIWFSDMVLENSLFYSPVLLPKVSQGENRFTIEFSEPGGQLCLEPDFSSLEALKPFCHSIDNLQYNDRFTERLTPPLGESGSLVVEVDPVGGSLIRSMTICGSFGIDPKSSIEDSIQILCAEGFPENWKMVWDSSTKRLEKSWEIGYQEQGRTPLSEHWRFDKSVEVYPSAACEKYYVMFRIKRNTRVSLNNLKVYAYYEPERPTKLRCQDFTVTHAWTEDGILRTHTESPTSARHSYTFIAADSLVSNQSVTIEVKNEGAL